MIPGDIDEVPELRLMHSSAREDARVFNWVPTLKALNASRTSLRLICSLLVQKSLHGASKRQLMAILVYLRGSRPIWVSHPKEPVRAKRSLWLIKENPHIMKWVKSDSFFKAPRYWPDQVAGSFRWRLIPSPREVGAIRMRSHPYTSNQSMFSHIVLVTYCHGVSVELLSEALDMSEGVIYDHMAKALSKLYDLPSFVVWATGTNFRKAPLPPVMLELLGEGQTRRERLTKLIRSPFLFERRFFAPWAESPSIRAYLIYGTPKKPRLTGQYYDKNLAEARS